jgi:poly-beta-1,6-N-acetyl-D-glucosamine synthase
MTGALMEILLPIIIICLLCAQIMFWLYFQCRLIFYNSILLQKVQSAIPVSIIISAKNEAQNLISFLPKVLEQNYPQYEVIVVNDGSSDESLKVLQTLRTKYSHLTIIDHPISKGKKAALTLGIHTAKFEHLLFTDADCYPTSAHWVSNMVSKFDQQKRIVLGYGKYAPQSGFLNAMIRYDTMQIASTYFSFALAKLPYMGVGRNLSYTKSLFKQHDGFQSHEHIASGDDDLFIASVANRENTDIVINAESHTASIAKDTWQAWMEQKIRHLSTAPFYSRTIKFLLILQFSLVSLFYIFSFIGLLSCKMPYLILTLIAIRAGILTYLNFKLSKVLVEGRIWYYSFIFEFAFIGIYPILQVRKRFEKPKTWKR